MDHNSSRVLIIGYGEMGHAMEHLLGHRHHLVIHDVQRIQGLSPIDIKKEAALADIVLLCIPTSALNKVLNEISPTLKLQCICLSIAKGLDDKGRTPAEIFDQTLKDRQPYGLLYGPMISEEICADRYAFAELGSTGRSTYRRVHELFKDTSLKVRKNRDMTGISWSVILKNVYAIAFGIADELGLGDNVRGHLAVAALSELQSIASLRGGKKISAFSLSGLGDLITTSTSAGSHHHELGRKLARGETEGITGEGIHTLSMIEKYRIFDSSTYRLFELIHQIVRSPIDAEKLFLGYLNRIAG